MLDPVIHDKFDALTTQRALEYYIAYITMERRDTAERQDEIERAFRILIDIGKRFNK